MICLNIPHLLQRLALVFLLFAMGQAVAQPVLDSVKRSSNPLTGLTKAGPGDIKEGTPLMLDPTITPVYTDSLQLISAADFMGFMMGGEYVPEPYIDVNKAVKAIVMRKATTEEKKRMQMMQQEMSLEKNTLLGMPASEFIAKDIKGKKVQLSALNGKIVVLNFWFIECKPCVMEIPDLNELYSSYRKEDVVFIALATNEKKQLKSFLKKTAFNYRIIPDSQATAALYNIKGFPTSVIIDQQGIIQYVSMGIGPNNKERLAEEINKLMIK